MRHLSDSPARACVSILVLLVFGTCVAVADFDPYVIADHRVSVDTEDVAGAKETALKEAITEGLERVLRRLTRKADRRRLPAPDQRLAEGLLDRLTIESETVAPKRYSARLRVSFAPLAVRGFLHRHGVNAVEETAPPVLLVPVLKDDGIPLWWDTAAAWAEALEAVSFADGLTPVRLPRNTAADRSERRERILAADRITLGDLRVRYRTQGAVAVVAGTVPGRDRVALSLIGTDAAGAIDVEEEVTGGLDAAAQRVADILSERWKAALSGTATGREQALSTLAVRVLLHDPGEWPDIRRRLAESGLVQGVAVESTQERGADIVLWHGGASERLAAGLARHGLDLFEAGGVWLLQSY